MLRPIAFIAAIGLAAFSVAQWTAADVQRSIDRTAKQMAQGRLEVLETKRTVDPEGSSISQVEKSQRTFVNPAAYTYSYELQRTDTQAPAESIEAYVEGDSILEFNPKENKAIVHRSLPAFQDKFRNEMLLTNGPCLELGRFPPGTSVESVARSGEHLQVVGTLPSGMKLNAVVDPGKDFVLLSAKRSSPNADMGTTFEFGPPRKFGDVWLPTSSFQSTYNTDLQVQRRVEVIDAEFGRVSMAKPNWYKAGVEVQDRRVAVNIVHTYEKLHEEFGENAPTLQQLLELSRRRLKEYQDKLAQGEASKPRRRINPVALSLAAAFGAAGLLGFVAISRSRRTQAPSD